MTEQITKDAMLMVAAADHEPILRNQHHPRLFLWEVNTFDFSSGTPVEITVHVLAEDWDGALLQSVRGSETVLTVTEMRIARELSEVKQVDSFLVRGWGNKNFNREVETA